LATGLEKTVVISAMPNLSMTLIENLAKDLTLKRQVKLYEVKLHFFKWKGIKCKQITRWQHLSWLKASAFFSLQKNF